MQADNALPMGMANGTVEDENTAGVTADHPARDPFPFLVAPSADGRVKNTLRIGLIPIGCWRLDDVRFGFGSTFLLPATKREFQELDELLKKHPKAPATVFGHADPVGDDAFNKQLSGERAEAVYALLIRDTARWEKLYKVDRGSGSWGIQSIQHMLIALGHPPAGGANGINDARTKVAVTEFQKKTPGLTVDGDAGPATREKLFKAYMDFLCPAKLTKTDFLGQGLDDGGKGDYQGCSEFNPAMVFSKEESQKLAKPDRDRENGVNRRVLILLFAPGTPPTAAWPCPRVAEGVAACKKRMWSDGEIRRNPQGARRKFADTQDTFACRFYHRLSIDSPCEGVKPPAVMEWIQYLLTEKPFSKKLEWWPVDEAGAHEREIYDTKLTNRAAGGALDEVGQVEFLQVPAGQCQVRFPKFYELAEKEFGAPFKWPIPAPLKPGPSPVPPANDTPKLALVTVDPFFAPGVDTLTIRYEINKLESASAHLIVTSDAGPATVLFERELTAAEKTNGANKIVEWDGIGADGKHIEPLQSPFTVTLQRADGTLKTKKPARVEVEKIDLTVDAPDNRFLMNVPAQGFLVTAVVFLRNKIGNGVKAPISTHVRLTFTPGAGNTTGAASFVFEAAKTLGKAGDPNAQFWDAHPSSTANSADGFKTSALAETGTAGPDLATARIFFHPSAVGGNKYKIKAALGGVNKESAEISVFRKVVFAPFEMQGQTHVSTNGTTALMDNFYKPDTFVIYQLGAVTQVAAAFKVKYIGLWDHATQAQKSWATVQRKLAVETLTADEIAKANGPAGAAQTAVRAAIRAKATAWFDRISADELTCLTNWPTDASVPINAMVSIEDRHPKFSANSPDADALTAEWTGLPWLQITVATRNIHPDTRWQNVQGFAFTSRAYVMAGTSGARARVVVAHEAGHETKNQFKRAPFGVGDHSAAAGLMDPTGSENDFTASEIKILKGIL